jgi:membrane protease subunit HflK
VHQHDDHLHLHGHDDCGHDHHGHRDPARSEEPLDAANESLADALRSSFRILKGIMVLLIVLYLFSNVRRVDSHEQALKLRLGRLLPQTVESGLAWALPYPIDEIVPLPTRKSNELRVKTHSFNRRADEEGKPLAMLVRSSDGLHPGLDGALVAADGGLVHVQWKVTYKIDDVRTYVSSVKTRELEAAEDMIRLMVETSAIQIAGELTAEELIRTRVEYVQSELARRTNERLAALGSGLNVARVEMFEPTPPIPVRDAFESTQRAENAKQSRIRDAEQKRSTILNEAAGAAHAELIEGLDALDAARKKGDPVEALEQKLDLLLTTQVEGHAGRMIKDAGSYQAVAVGQMRADLELYQTLVPEFERNPGLLVGRLWEETREKILGYTGVTKVYVPPQTQVRIHVGLDPEQTRIEEARELQDTTFDATKLRPERLRPLGPDEVN